MSSFAVIFMCIIRSKSLYTYLTYINKLIRTQASKLMVNYEQIKNNVRLKHDSKMYFWTTMRMLLTNIMTPNVVSLLSKGELAALSFLSVDFRELVRLYRLMFDLQSNLYFTKSKQIWNIDMKLVARASLPCNLNNGLVDRMQRTEGFTYVNVIPGFYVATHYQLYIEQNHRTFYIVVS